MRGNVEARERSAKPADLNEQVINLLDSFDHNNTEGSRSQQHLHASASLTTPIQNLADPGHLHHGSLSGLPVVNKGNGNFKSEVPHHSKVPRLMATLLYPEQPHFPPFGADNTRVQFDPHLLPPRSSGGSSAALPSFNPTLRGFSPSRFSRPPPRGPRW